MRLIIAGSRTITDVDKIFDEANKFIEEFGIAPVEIVSGTCQGPDKIGERYAEESGVPTKRFPANWSLYGKAAGPIRNEEMAKYATHALIFWDGKSKGTKNMITHCTTYGLIFRVIKCNT